MANESGKTMTAVIEDALHQMLAQRKVMHSSQPVRLITVSGDGLQAGIDLDDSAALLDLMEQPNDAA